MKHRCPQPGRRTTLGLFGRTLVLAALSALALASSAKAQEVRRLLLQGGGAYVLVPKCCQDYIDSGWSTVGTVGLRLGSHIWVMGSVSYLWLDGEGARPDWRNRAFFGTLGYDLLTPGFNGAVVLYVGGGSIAFDPDSDGLGSESYPAVNAGVKLVYDLSRHLAGTLDLGAALAFSETDYIGGATLLLPMGVGLALRF